MQRSRRLDEIVSLIYEHNYMSVKELSLYFLVSEVTIRTDLTELEKRGQIVRKQGGAMKAAVNESLNSHWSFEHETREQALRPTVERQHLFREQKIQIATKAITFLQPYDRIILDASSTALCIAEQLPKNLPLVIVTNALNIISSLAHYENIKLISVGGMLSNSSMSFIGPIAEKNFENYHVNKTFFSCEGVHFESGITDSNDLQVILKRKMMACAEEVFLICDSSKIGHKDLAYLASLQDIDMFITDSNIKREQEKILNDLGIAYEIAK